MDGPNREIRDEIISILDETRPPEVRTGQDEQLAVLALTRIEQALLADISGDNWLGPRISDLLAGRRVEVPELDSAQANALLVVAHEWAGLASYVSARVYGPGSPMPKKLVGWSRGAIATLQRIASLLLVGLRTAGQALGAANVSIGVSFPWGISISLTW
jgi:hypothetical protein